jgi:hypothetical protein
MEEINYERYVWALRGLGHDLTNVPKSCLENFASV